MGVPRLRPMIACKGQTVIETIFMLLILIVLFFMIAEFARAWYLKNSLNNAVRVAVRKAVVTPNLTAASESCTSASSEIVDAVCSSPGVPQATTVEVTLVDDADPSGFGSGDTVEVSARADFDTVVPDLPWVIFPDSAYSEASMRYE